MSAEAVGAERCPPIGDTSPTIPPIPRILISIEGLRIWIRTKLAPDFTLDGGSFKRNRTVA
jgi:hypothetical protein